MHDEQNMEQLLRDAWEQFDDQIGRTVERFGGQSISGLASQDFGRNGFAIHCARYFDGQPVGVIPMEPEENVRISEQEPDDDENFLTSDFMALVRNNDFILVNAGRNAASVREYITKLFQSVGYDDNTQQFNIVRRGNADKLAMIRRIGVKAIGFDVSINAAEAALVQDAPLHNEGKLHKLKRNISHVAQSLFQEDNNFRDIREAQRGKLSVKLDVGSKDPLAAQEGLKRFAEAVADENDADNFIIELKNDNVIRPDEIALRKRVSVNSEGNSVNVEEVWRHMIEYLIELTPAPLPA